MDKAKEISDRIYRLYGSDSGYLLGIPPELKTAVEAIVKLTVNMVEEED